MGISMGEEERQLDISVQLHKVLLILSSAPGRLKAG